MIDPGVSIDDIVDKVKAHDHPISWLELKATLPLFVYTPMDISKRPEGFPREGGAPAHDIPKSVEIYDEDVKRIFDIEPEEFHRMETFVRKVLYSQFARRLGVVPGE